MKEQIIRCVLVLNTAGTGVSAEFREEADDPLLEYEIVDVGVSIRVPTGGCTEKSDYQPHIERELHERYLIRFDKMREDDCKGFFPEGIEFVYTWVELKVNPKARVEVVNPTRDDILQ